LDVSFLPCGHLYCICRRLHLRRVDRWADAEMQSSLGDGNLTILVPGEIVACRRHIKSGVLHVLGPDLQGVWALQRISGPRSASVMEWHVDPPGSSAPMMRTCKKDLVMAHSAVDKQPRCMRCPAVQFKPGTTIWTGVRVETNRWCVSNHPTLPNPANPPESQDEGSLPIQ
jgi:hypothetical protein